MDSIDKNKAIFRQREARRWQRIAEWCRDMYAQYGDSGYLNEYHHAATLSKHHYRAARILMGIEPYGLAFSVSSVFEMECRFDAFTN